MACNRRLRFPIAVAAATGLALCIAGPASAHIHTDPSEVQAGTEATVGFMVEHGCEDSPTTQVEIQMPDGATDIAGVDGDGFTTSVDGQVVTFSGGTLGPDTEKAFEVSFTAPTEAGEVPVKIIQTCEEGSLEWIEVPAEGEAEPEHPAPILVITEGVPTGEGDHHAESGDDEGDDHAATETTEAESDHHAEASEPTAAGADASATEDEGDSSSSTGLIVAGVAAIVVLAGGGLLYARSKKSGAGSGATDGEATPEPPSSPEA